MMQSIRLYGTEVTQVRRLMASPAGLETVARSAARRQHVTGMA
jgi:hypothetical protein